MVDSFGNDDLDSSHILSRISPCLRQHLCMKRRESERVVVAVLVRVWRCVSVGFLHWHATVRTRALICGQIELVYGTAEIFRVCLPII